MASIQVTALAQAIARAEGFGVPGAIPTLANNPGDITDTGHPGDTGRTMGVGIRVYASSTAGWNALYGKLTNILGGGSSEYPVSLTFAEFGDLWAGGDPNWVNNVASELGLDPSTTLAQFAGGTAAGSTIDVTPISITDGNAIPLSDSGDGSGSGSSATAQPDTLTVFTILTVLGLGAYLLSDFLLD
jgi:hypothetical protein